MNKAEFVGFIAEVGSISKVDAEKALNLITESVTKAIHKGLEISLVGFGSFHVQSREARDGRNPKTGAKMRIAAYKQPVFRAGKNLKEACNS
ncbi:MAG: HU family DNA-binding protein [Pseudomonadota bacterium]